MSSKPKTTTPEQSESAKIVRDLYNRGPLNVGLTGALSPTSDDPYAQMAQKRLVESIRGGYGARGLAGSGIAQKGESEGVANMLTDLAYRKEQIPVEILKAGSGSPSFGQPAPGRGFMGLK
jgi:hypothetical protein